MTALQELLAKVEVGEWDTKLALKALPESHVNDAHEWVDPIGWASRAFHYGDLNAAKALHEWVIDDYNFLLGFDWAEVWLPFGSKLHKFNVANTNPARAWLIAIIKALIAQEKAT